MRIFPILGWMLFPGCWAVTGPGAVSGPPGGSVTVRCRYDSGYERSPKFWCQKESRWRCSNGFHIVETDGSEAEVKRGRVSIRDNHTLSMFTVTVENLTQADAGTYQCGVRQNWYLDPRTAVELTVSPASSTESSSSSTAQPSSSSTSKPNSIWTTAEEGTPSISTNQGITATGVQDSDILLYILLPCVLLVLMLFLLAAVMLARLSKKRKKALSRASVQRDKKIHLSNLESKATEEVSYATVMISIPDQQPIYANVAPRPNATRPANPPEQTLYSAVK